MFCSNCGTKGQGKFCATCGAQVGVVPAATHVMAEPVVASQPVTSAASPHTYGVYNGYTPVQPAVTSGLAIGALITSFFIPLIGLILGIVARNEIRNSNGTKGGEGMAKAAIILSSIWMGIIIIWAVIVGAAAGSYYN